MAARRRGHRRRLGGRSADRPRAGAVLRDLRRRPRRPEGRRSTRTPSLVLTDTNRRRAVRWSTVRETNGYTERRRPGADEVRPQRPAARRLPRRRRRQPHGPGPEGRGVGGVDRLRQPGHVHARGPAGQRHRRRPGQQGHRLADERLLERHRPEAAHPLRQADHQRRALPPPGPGRRPQPLHHRGRRSPSTARTRSPFRSVGTPACRRGEVLELPKHTYSTLEIEIANTDPGAATPLRQHGRGRLRRGQPEAR